MLTAQRMEVSASGELVHIRIGNTEFRLQYEDALKLSQWIRYRAKQAKRTAGDTSRHWSVVGTLSDPSITRT